MASNFNMGPIALWLYVSLLTSVKYIKFSDFKWLSIHSFYQLQFCICACMIFNELSILNFDMGLTALSQQEGCLSLLNFAKIYEFISWAVHRYKLEIILQKNSGMSSVYTFKLYSSLRGLKW